MKLRQWFWLKAAQNNWPESMMAVFNNGYDQGFSEGREAAYKAMNARLDTLQRLDTT